MKKIPYFFLFALSAALFAPSMIAQEVVSTITLSGKLVSQGNTTSTTSGNKTTAKSTPVSKTFTQKDILTTVVGNATTAKDYSLIMVLTSNGSRTLYAEKGGNSTTRIAVPSTVLNLSVNPSNKVDVIKTTILDQMVADGDLTDATGFELINVNTSNGTSPSFAESGADSTTRVAVPAATLELGEVTAITTDTEVTDTVNETVTFSSSGNQFTTAALKTLTISNQCDLSGICTYATALKFAMVKLSGSPPSYTLYSYYAETLSGTVVGTTIVNSKQMNVTMTMSLKFARFIRPSS